MSSDLKEFLYDDESTDISVCAQAEAAGKRVVRGAVRGEDRLVCSNRGPVRQITDIHLKRLQTPCRRYQVVTTKKLIGGGSHEGRREPSGGEGQSLVKYRSQGARDTGTRSRSGTSDGISPPRGSSDHFGPLFGGHGVSTDGNQGSKTRGSRSKRTE